MRSPRGEDSEEKNGRRGNFLQRVFGLVIREGGDLSLKAARFFGDNDDDDKEEIPDT